ncbi:MAG: hypothetical protein CVV46_08110 [Spirochaetae bacterium HGW-Spirochaetae-2]|jgi:multidrug efflux pump subunit AcrA (membrane-fusion protein)|nr:MAG: hypothetical protein CVV46_08110 [Spirochaetae bacterium HGW-Spirochaetae-2]
MKFERFVTILLLIVILFVAYSLVQNTKSSREVGKPIVPNSQQDPTDAAINVRVQVMEPTTFVKTTDITGELVRKDDSKSLYSDVTGKITAIVTKRGDTVAAGDVVAYVNPSTPGAVYRERAVTATTGGVIQSVDTYTGHWITADTTLLFTIADPSDLVLEVKLPERYISMVSVGVPATFTTVAWPDEPFSAEVTYISSSVDPLSRTVEIELGIEPDDRLKSGMFVSVKLLTGVFEQVLVVEKEAISSYLGEKAVFTIKGGEARRTLVTTGSESDSQAIVTSGLEVGDQVVIAGSVVEGSTVHIL